MTFLSDLRAKVILYFGILIFASCGTVVNVAEQSERRTSEDVTVLWFPSKRHDIRSRILELMSMQNFGLGVGGSRGAEYISVPRRNWKLARQTLMLEFLGEPDVHIPEDPVELGHFRKSSSKEYTFIWGRDQRITSKDNNSWMGVLDAKSHRIWTRNLIFIPHGGAVMNDGVVAAYSNNSVHDNKNQDNKNHAEIIVYAPDGETLFNYSIGRSRWQIRDAAGVPNIEDILAFDALGGFVVRVRLDIHGERAWIIIKGKKYNEVQYINPPVAAFKAADYAARLDPIACISLADAGLLAVHFSIRQDPKVHQYTKKEESDGMIALVDRNLKVVWSKLIKDGLAVANNEQESADRRWDLYHGTGLRNRKPNTFEVYSMADGKWHIYQYQRDAAGEWTAAEK